MIIKTRIQSRLKRSKRHAFTCNDLKNFVGYDQAGRILRDRLFSVGEGS
ncbi:Uncharacterised protein [Serratia fonticola]|nr:Uncharacterised protein [Serratia fonticola]